MDLMDIVFAVAGALVIASPYLGDLAFGRANAVTADEARITRDIELEPTALAKIDTKLSGLGDIVKMTALRNMLAWNELPSYITEEVVEQGIEAVERLIERTSYLRKQKAHDYAATGLVVTAS